MKYFGPLVFAGGILAFVVWVAQVIWVIVKDWHDPETRKVVRGLLIFLIVLLAAVFFMRSIPPSCVGDLCPDEDIEAPVYRER